LVYRGEVMKSRGVSGFGVIIIIIVLIIIGYVVYQIGRLQFSYGSIKNKVEDAAKMGTAQTDAMIIEGLIKDAAEVKVQLNLAYDTIIIDRGIRDSFRIYLTYNDSSNIFGVYTYYKHFVIDVVKPIKVRF